MDYALTYSIDDWDNTDTIIVSVDTTPDEGDSAWYEDHEAVADVLRSQGIEDDEVNYIINKGRWFVRNCADTDYVLITKGA